MALPPTMTEIYVVPIGLCTFYIIEIPGHNMAFAIAVYPNGAMLYRMH